MSVQWYKKLLPVLTGSLPPKPSSNQYSMWYERFVTSYCRLVGLYVLNEQDSPTILIAEDAAIAPTAILSPFQAWAEFLEGGYGYTNTHQGFMRSGRMGATREDIWRCYYSTLTIFLQARVVIIDSSPPQKQFDELYWVQSHYGEALQAGQSFPAADKATPRIDEFVHQLTANWNVVLTAYWPDKISESRSKLTMCKMAVNVSNYYDQVEWRALKSRTLVLTASRFIDLQPHTALQKFLFDLYIYGGFQASKKITAPLSGEGGNNADQKKQGQGRTLN